MATRYERLRWLPLTALLVFYQGAEPWRHGRDGIALTGPRMGCLGTQADAGRCTRREDWVW